jgi:abhydrolase domain-containing protein 13
MGFRLPNIDLLYAGCKGTMNIFMLEYRGYGESTGTADEEGLGKDVDAALEHLSKRTDIDTSNVFVFGRSLGGAVAVRGAVGRCKSTVRGLILENTFTCISDMVDRLFPSLRWVKNFVLKIHWPTIERLKTLEAVPTMFISGGADELIPADHMKRNFLAHPAPAANKAFVLVTTGAHNTTWMQGGWRYFKEMMTFIHKHSSPSAQEVLHIPSGPWWEAKGGSPLPDDHPQKPSAEPESGAEAQSSPPTEGEKHSAEDPPLPTGEGE